MSESIELLSPSTTIYYQTQFKVCSLGVTWRCHAAGSHGTRASTKDRCRCVGWSNAVTGTLYAVSMYDEEEVLETTLPVQVPVI
jgi:hypothetical protein